MKLITELIEFALQRHMLTEEHKRKLQDDGFYKFFEEDEEDCSTYDYDYDYDYRDSYQQDAYSPVDDELDRTYYGDYYHPGKRSGSRRGKRKRPSAGPELTVEELNCIVEEEWKKLTEEFPRLEPLWDSWKAGKLKRVFTDGFTLNDVYALMKVESRDFHEFSGPAPTAFRQLLRQVGSAMGKYSWVIKSQETASMVEFSKFRQQILEEVRELYETDRERFVALSAQNGKLNFPYWENAVQTDTTSMKVWTILNLTSTPVTPERIEAVLTWKPELAIAMQMELDYLTELLTKLEQRDWSSLTVVTECDIDKTILKTVIIPKGVKAIGRCAFNSCSSLTSIEIPEGVKEIGWHAFVFCSSLTSIEIPKGVKEIGWYAFRNCSSLTSIVIPKGVKWIGGGAFISCYSLTSVALPEDLTSIRSETFMYCESLTSVVIHEGVTKIGDGAFSGCSSLTSIVIPKGVSAIGSKTFLDCSSLTSVVIPEDVKEIGDGAFENCPNLTIHAPAGSYTEQYAKSNNIPFQPLEEEKISSDN